MEDKEKIKCFYQKKTKFLIIIFIKLIISRGYRNIKGSLYFEFWGRWKAPGYGGLREGNRKRGS